MRRRASNGQRPSSRANSVQQSQQWKLTVVESGWGRDEARVAEVLLSRVVGCEESMWWECGILLTVGAIFE